MRLKRKNWLVALAATSAMALGACGSSTGPADPADGTSSAPVVEEPGDDPPWDEASGQYQIEEAIASGAEALTLWVEEDYLAEAIVAAFNEEYPDVRVEYELVGKKDAVSKMALAGEAGTGADVFITVYDLLATAIEDGTAAPLGRYQETLEDRLSPTFTGVVSAEGTMFAVPMTTESIALFYNKTLLSELTGSAEPATTWEQIVELAAEYNDPAANRWTIRFLAGEIYYAYPVLSSLGWEVYPGGDPADPGFGDPALAEGLEYYAGLRDSWNVPSADATWDTIEVEFAKGETPYTISGPWSFSTFDDGAAENGFEYGVAVLPAVEGGAPAASLAGLQVAAVSGYTEYPGAARVFANFLASDAGASAIYTSTGMIPALNPELHSAIEGLSDDPRVAGIVSQSQQAALLPQVPPHFWETGNTLVVDVWDGLLPVADAIDKAQQAYDDLGNL